MLCQSAVAYQQIDLFLNDKVQARRTEIQKAIAIVGDVVNEVLKNVEQVVVIFKLIFLFLFLKEPRFISTFTYKGDGQYEGVWRNI